MIRLCARQSNCEVAAALAVSCDAMRRRPSDLIAMRADSLVGLGRSTQHRWPLLLYPAEFTERSKMWGCGRGSDPQAPHLGKGPLLGQVGDCGVSAGPTFLARFQELLKELREWSVMPYQTRHGAASHATAVDCMVLSELQARLRHVSAPGSRVIYDMGDTWQNSKKVPAALARRAEVSETALTTQSWSGCELPPLPCWRARAITSNGVCALLRTRCLVVADSFTPNSALAWVSWQRRQTCGTFLVLSGCPSKWCPCMGSKPGSA